MEHKVFTFVEGKKVQDWAELDNPYQPTKIGEINNPDGDLSKEDPSSIPTPFARIDLVREAFQYVANSPSLEGKTVYHRLVSHAFDLAELFFNIDALGSEVKIDVWDKEEDLEQLIVSSNAKHRLLGETLELFLKQDADSNNFDDLKKIYFLSYDYKIVGGTSPTTLFFTCGNELSFAKIKMGNDVFFDDVPRPLFKRDPDFQKYLYTLSKVNSTLFSNKMKDFSKYLEESLKSLEPYNRPLRREIKKILEDTPLDTLENDLNSLYAPLDAGEEQDDIKLLGMALKKKKPEDKHARIAEESEFTIRTSNEQVNTKPLVLPQKLSETLAYTTKDVVWNSKQAVPYVDPLPLNERILPGQLDQYPYFTVSDFLEPYLMRLSYKINSEKFFDGNIVYDTRGDENKSYLLPLTKNFFHYFSIEDLQGRTKDGKPIFEMKVFTHEVVVKLRVPIKGNKSLDYITLERAYQHPIEEIDGSFSPKPLEIEENNKGSIVENKFTFLIHPFVKMNNGIEGEYRVMMIDNDLSDFAKGKAFDLSFYKQFQKEALSIHAKTYRSTKEIANAQTDFYALNDYFDYVGVKHGGVNAIALPLMKTSVQSTDAYSFAVDFGTSYTYIEYSVNGIGTQIFDINENDELFSSLFTNTKDDENEDIQDFRTYIIQEFLPFLIEDDGKFFFPIRSAISKSQGLKNLEDSVSLADFNIPFLQDKKLHAQHFRVTTNLKWGTSKEGEVNIKRFIENVILLLKAKVLLNQGDLAKTKLVWFYPSSMNSSKITLLENEWRRLFEKHIAPPQKETLIKISESIAPFYYYQHSKGVSAASKPAIGIDIGGGTTDVVIYKATEPIVLTSFRYAGNTIFGDGYNSNASVNGFVLRYFNDFIKAFQNRGLLELEELANNFMNKPGSDSADICTFLFSLEKNIETKGQDQFNFNNKLKSDEHLKVVFILFYAAIIYHIAKLMKVKGLDVPGYIIFSGTASKVLTIADPAHDYTSLSEYTSLIFQKVLAKESLETIELKQHENPKEVTSKGGLLIKNKEAVDVDRIKHVLLGDGEERMDDSTFENKITYVQLKDEGIYANVVNEVKTFFDLFISLNQDFNYHNKFGINSSSFEIFQQLSSDNSKIKEYLMLGIQNKQEEIGRDDTLRVEESLFFYPLVGFLNTLASKVAQEK